jgi:hypothetical protein
MTPYHERIEAIRERAEKATPPSWALAENSLQPIVTSGAWPFGKDICTCKDGNDADFIAHARDDIPFLLSTIAALESENAELKVKMREIYEDENDHAPGGGPP